jgi:SpoVK/Ycf46/Vps4 family AAA+-type ATPase
MLRALGGVTIKECAELAQLTMARDGGLTAQGIVATRKQFFQGQRGLTLVESHQDFYLPDPELAEWIERERPFFVNEGVDPRLVPRGLLLDGPPGVGKTSGAKYIADKWGVPLYRFDLSGTKDKYVGQSERFMSANLQRIDQEEPCVVLFDEIEKSFSVTHFGGDGNTSSGMLSQLLWWLAEHKSRVLSIMTTNDARKLPPELHRERRIDRAMELEGLSIDEAEGFVEALLKTFSIFGDNDLLDGHIETIVQSIKLPPEEEGRISHAALTEVIYSYVKQLQTHLSSGD